MPRKHVNIILSIGIIIFLVVTMCLLIGCTMYAQRKAPLCSDFVNRTTINVKAMLMKTPRFVERRLAYLESMSIIDSEHMEILNFRLEDGGRLKVNFRDGYAIGFTVYHNVPFHTA